MGEEVEVEAPWLPGHGGRPSPAGAGWAECAAAVAPPRPGIWVGYSLGARVAMAALAHCPDQVSGLVLIGGHPGLQSTGDRADRARWERPHHERLAAGDLDAFLAAWETEPIFASQAALPAERQAEQRRWREGHDPAGLAAAFDALALSRMPDRRPLLRGTTVPVTLVTGARDPRYRAIAAELQALAPDLRHHVVDGAGHNVPLEAPAELAAILRACALAPSPSPSPPSPEARPL